ncbi:hypothetical protein AB0K15_34835 [Amycolatopsis sp. NPDC049253]|uniref:hypothetical protein n=1 Tax=Amycolatopsis sp. NPDC049253 TaxID=3155274 RepID=UPI003428ADF4
MRNAHPTRRELELRFDGLDEDLDLTELLAGHHDAAAVLVETGPECEELAEVADLLAEFDAELAARETAEVPADAFADVVALGDWVVAGVAGQGKTAGLLHAVIDLATIETEGEVA